MHYLAYDQVGFDVIVGTYGHNFDRYAIRLDEVRESVRIVRQALGKMPRGDYRVQDKKVTPPPRARTDSRSRPSSTTSSSTLRDFTSPKERSTPRSSRPAARSAATSSPTARPSPTGATSGRRRS